MKEIIKKLLGELVDLIAIPFEFIYKFIKNADNIIHTVVRAILLIVLFFVIIYVSIAKPYKKLFRGFQFEKYSTEKEARTALLKQFPLNNTSVEEYSKYLVKIGAKCYKVKSGQRCIYKKNTILKKYNWVVNIKKTEKGKSLSINIRKPKSDKKNKLEKNTQNKTK